MTNMRCLVAACLMVSAVALVGCSLGGAKPYIDFRRTESRSASAQAQTPALTPVRIAVAPVLPHKDTIGFYRQLAEHLAIQMGRPTELIQRQSNSDVSILLSNGGADIALFSTGAYVTWPGEPAVEPLVMQQRSGVPFYYSYIVVAKDGGIVSFDGLRGKSFAFTDTLSFSGYLYPASLVKRSGSTPEQFFGRYLFTYSHIKSLRAVAEKVVDGAAIDSLAYEQAKLTVPELADAVRVIATSMPVGTGPVVVKKEMNEEQKELIRSIFLNMHYNRDMQQTLQGLMIERFIAVRPEYYAYPASVVDGLKGKQP